LQSVSPLEDLLPGAGVRGILADDGQVTIV
jgi:hypothetical protein